ncbi:MAG: hypothetical protein Q9195_002541 [Heterodermia aff. obscurata]
MTSTGPKAVHTDAPELLTTKIVSESTGASSTAPDAAREKGPDNDSTNVEEENQGKAIPDDEKSDELPSGARLVFIILALVLSIFLVSLDLTIVATAITKITDEFHGLEDVSWYSSAFFMTIGGFQSTWGKISKYFPLKLSFLISIFAFELGSLICGVAPTSTALIMGRAIAGLGAAGIGSGTYTIIAFSSGPRNRPMFTGIIGTSYGIAAVVGPLLGGALADNFTWSWCFYINLPIGAVSAQIILLFFKTPRAAEPGGHLFTRSFCRWIPYILALHYGGMRYAWKSSQVVGLLVGFVTLSAAFAAWEWCQEDRAMIQFRLAGERVYIVSSVIDNVSAAMSGVRNLPLILAVTISMLCAGAYISVTGIAAPVIVAGNALGLVCTGLLYTFDKGTSEGKWIGYQVIGGVGWGIASQIPIITVQATAPAADLAEATAILLFFQTVGGAFMVSAEQADLVNILVRVLPHSALDVAGFTRDQVAGILVAYMRGLKISFAIGMASTGMASTGLALVIITMFQKWNRLNPAAIAGGGSGA